MKKIIKKIFNSLYFSTFLLPFFFINTDAFARVIRVSKCTIPFDFTIGSVCVLGTLSLGILGIVIMFGLNIILAIIKTILSKIFK